MKKIISIPIILIILGYILFVWYYPHLISTDDYSGHPIFIVKSLSDNEIYLISNQKDQPLAKFNNGEWHGLSEEKAHDYTNYQLLNAAEIKNKNIFNKYFNGKEEIKFKESKPLAEKYWITYKGIRPFGSIYSLKITINEKYIQLTYSNAAGSGFENSIKQCYFVEGNQPVVIYSKDMTFEIFE